jgi:hypothetical protein
MNVEPREKNFLILNLFASKSVKREIERWIGQASGSK